MPSRNEIAEELEVQYYKELSHDEAGYDKKFWIALVTDAYGAVRRSVLKETNFLKLLQTDFQTVKSYAETFPNDVYSTSIKPKKNSNGKWVIEYPTKILNTLGGSALISFSPISNIGCCKKIIISKSDLFSCAIGSKKAKVKANNNYIELINFTDEMLEAEYEIEMIPETPSSLSTDGDFEINGDWAMDVRNIAWQSLSPTENRGQDKLNDGLDSWKRMEARTQAILQNNNTIK